MSKPTLQTEFTVVEGDNVQNKVAVGITAVLCACTVRKDSAINTKKGGERPVNRNMGTAVTSPGGQGEEVM